MADKVKKAHGHIIQADWNQTDPLKMDYIHNKPEIPNISVIPDSIIGFDGEGKSVNWDISYGDSDNIISDAIVQRTGQDIKVPDHFESEQSFSGTYDVISSLSDLSSTAISGLDLAVTSSVIFEDLHSSVLMCYDDMDDIAISAISSLVNAEIVLGGDVSGSFSQISYTSSNSSSTIPFRNEDGTFEIGNANINFTDGGGFSCPAQDAYNYALNEGKGSLPVTVSDISSMLNNFDINLSGIKQAMYYGSGAFDDSDCYGVLPIPTASDLQTFSDLPLFAKNKPTSIPVRSESGNIDVALTPVEEAHAASKYYVDHYQKKIRNLDCTVVNVESTFGINVWEAPAGYNGTLFDFYAPIQIPESCIGKEVVFSIDTSISSVYLTNTSSNSSNSSGYPALEQIGIVSSKGESFWQDAENCLAYNEDGRGWEIKEYRCIPTSTMMYLALVEPNAGIPENWKDEFLYKYSLYLKLNMSCREYSENGTPVHDTYLHSDTEMHIKDPIDSIVIEDLVRCYPADIAQEWTLSFKTSSNLPSITIPNNTIIPVRHAYQEDKFDNNYNVIGVVEKFEYVNQQLPIKWLYAEPVFEANKKYLITFKQILDTIYGVWTVLE